MKKFVLIMLAFMASFSVYAQEVNTNNNEEVAVTSQPILLGSFRIDISEVIYPYTIDIPTPTGTILGISGPTDPLLQTWYVQNGRLIIELYEDDLCDVRAGNTHHLSVASTSGNMIIELIII